MSLRHDWRSANPYEDLPPRIYDTLLAVPQAPSILNSWKEIASYLERGIRTVQRWHATLHLPVHRITRGDKKGLVFAYKGEIDRWMERQARHGLTAKVDRRRAATKQSRDKVSSIQQRLRLWQTASEPSQELENHFEHTRQLGFTFMSNDLDAALILAKMAEQARDADKKSRTAANARRALDTVLDLYRRTKLTADERSVLNGKITEVRAALERIAPQPRSE